MIPEVVRMQTFTNEKYGLTEYDPKKNLLNKVHKQANQATLDEINKPRSVTGFQRVATAPAGSNENHQRSTYNPEMSRIMVVPKETHAALTGRSMTAGFQSSPIKNFQGSLNSTLNNFGYSAMSKFTAYATQMQENSNAVVTARQLGFKIKG